MMQDSECKPLLQDAGCGSQPWRGHGAMAYTRHLICSKTKCKARYSSQLKKLRP